MKKRISTLIYSTFLLLTVGLLHTSCRIEPPLPPEGPTTVTPGDSSANVTGVYILNEGNMGSNKASLDYYSYITGEFFSNVFQTRNPELVKNLGDVGNDIQIYGSKMYAVINCSNLIEVMHAENALHIGEIEIPNCRYIVFDQGYAYVSSYAGPIPTGGDLNIRSGYVAKIDTTTLQVIDTLTVGYQPDEMVVANGRLYVANSGGYMPPVYDNRISVINLSTFTVENEITVAPNLYRIAANSEGKLFVSSRGDYTTNHQSKLFVVDMASNSVTDSVDISVGNMCMFNDTLYIITSNMYGSGKNETYRLDTKTMKIGSDKIVTDGTLEKMSVPYGLGINPENGDIFITDAKTYVVPGTVYCFNHQGELKFSIVAGQIPAHFAFLRQIERK